MKNLTVSGNLQVDGVVQITDKLFFGNDRIMSHDGVFFFQNNANTPTSMTVAPILTSQIYLGYIGGPRIYESNDVIVMAGKTQCYDLDVVGSINLT